MLKAAQYILTLGLLVMICGCSSVTKAEAKRINITDFGAIADGKTINTAAIQQGIDKLANEGGGTLVVPQGIFISGALFFKPGVNLHLDKDAVLQCSRDIEKDFPRCRTRIEGHFEPQFTPALINADGCDGFELTGDGTLGGDGKPVWDQFWKLRKASADPKNFANISIPRARLALIENSKNVVVQGVTFKDSQFWNLHIYRCQDSRIENVSFKVPDDYKQAPSTDAIDLDSCQQITVKGCYFSVTDDCIAMKGSKGPRAMEDTDSPPVEHVRISNCTYKRGGGVLTLGSEATVVRDVIVENCQVIGEVSMAILKLRPDTPQRYEDIHYRDITIENKNAAMVSIQPWSQYANLDGHEPPKSVVQNITFTNIKGRAGSFGTIRPNRGQTEIRNITFENIDLTLKDDKPKISGVKNLQIKNVLLNANPWVEDVKN